ncbi:unnamed protein product [Caenorhabditis auriculariae]|uniref:Uncharacterized protein n=1 Tax=Caenorhabditis auriculariae TaxID=2777116 RepID=A0A8S1HLG7_9PELO|nr:unnamed protein product [Caenorhabditis auriculariae]
MPFRCPTSTLYLPEKPEGSRKRQLRRLESSVVYDSSWSRNKQTLQFERISRRSQKKQANFAVREDLPEKPEGSRKGQLRRLESSVVYDSSWSRNKQTLQFEKVAV